MQKLAVFNKPTFTSQFEEDRSQDQSFYKSAIWRCLRVRQLQEFPLCNDCGRPGNEVHHIKKRETNPELELVLDNLQTLCKSCHTKQTHKEQFGSYQTIILLGYPNKTNLWLDNNKQPGDLVIDLSKLKEAIGFLTVQPTDIKDLLDQWKNVVCRMIKNDSLKRRTILIASEYVTAAQLQKELGATIEPC